MDPQCPICPQRVPTKKRWVDSSDSLQTCVIKVYLITRCRGATTLRSLWTIIINSRALITHRVCLNPHDRLDRGPGGVRGW